MRVRAAATGWFPAHRSSTGFVYIIFFLSRNFKQRPPKPFLGCTATAKEKCTKFFNFNIICKEQVRIFLNFLNIVVSLFLSNSRLQCKPRSPSFIALESRPLLPKFGMPLGGQASLLSTGEPEGWIYIPSRLSCSKFCLDESRPFGRWLLLWTSMVFGVFCFLVE